MRFFSSKTVCFWEGTKSPKFIGQVISCQSLLNARQPPGTLSYWNLFKVLPFNMCQPNCFGAFSSEFVVQKIWEEFNINFVVFRFRNFLGQKLKKSKIWLNFRKFHQHQILNRCFPLFYAFCAGKQTKYAPETIQNVKIKKS